LIADCWWIGRPQSAFGDPQFTGHAMARWQRNARLLIAVFGILFAALVARQLKPRDPPPDARPLVRTDPTAVIETTGGKGQKVRWSREDVSVEYQKQLTYPDGTSKLQGVTIVTDERNGNRTFTISGKEGRVGKDDSSIALDGDVRLAGSDGMTALAEHATYSDADAVVRAPGPVHFTRGRMSGTGVGLTWDKTLDILTILDQAVVHFAPDDKGSGALAVTSGNAAFARRDKYLRFENGVHIQHGSQLIDAGSAVALLSQDDKRIETVDLREQPRITVLKPSPGALRTLAGAQMNLKYAADGESLEHTLVTGDAVIQLAADAGKQERQIAAGVIDIALAPDGSTPTALTGRDAVQLTFPPEPGSAGRTIRAASMDARGEAGKGLTRAQFAGNVQYNEREGDVTRAANAGTLDLGLKPGMSSIDQATFAQSVRFEEGRVAAMATVARYDVDKGTLALSGSERGTPVPHVVNEQIAVDAAEMDVTLAGPKLKATGDVRSELRPSSKAKAGAADNEVKMPSMLKQDQPVIVVATSLDYDGTVSKGTYTGAARLFQGDTSIKGETIVVDNKLGNLSASGGVTTTAVLDQHTKDTTDTKGTKDTTDPKKERTHSIARSKELTYDDAHLKLTYTGEAHMSGPEGDMTAERIELYLKPSGDELERAEGHGNLTLREQNRETKGEKMIYTTANETYVITGAPVKIIDQCERETVGRTLTFNKGTDSVVVDGNSQIRTQTKGGNGKCTS